MKCEYCRKNEGAKSRFLGIICTDCWDEVASNRAHYDRIMTQDLTGQDEEAYA